MLPRTLVYTVWATVAEHYLCSVLWCAYTQYVSPSAQRFLGFLLVQRTVLYLQSFLPANIVLA